MSSAQAAAVAIEQTREATVPAPGQRPCVFFQPRHPTSWVRMLDMVEVIRAAGAFEPVVILSTAALAEKAEFCRERGITFVDVSAEVERRRREGGERSHALLERLDRWAQGHERLGNCLPVSLLRLRHARRRLRVEQAVFRALCEAWRPLAVFVTGDRELSPVPPMLRVALDLDIPSVIAFSGVPDTVGAASLRKDYPRFRVEWRYLPPLLNIYAAWKYPKQVCDSEFGRLLFSPGWLVLAHAGLDMLSASPWIQGGGHSRFVLQNNRRRMQYFIDRGVPESKLVLIGDPTLDPLFAACRDRVKTRARLQSSLGLTEDRKLVVVSVPNDAEHGFCDWKTHLARMEAFMRPLADHGAEVVLSLHPKSRPSDYRALAERKGFHFADRPLVDILPAADLYVCSASSTVLWANLAAVPAINLDYLDLGSFEFWDNPAVTNVVSPVELSQALARLLDRDDAGQLEAIEAYAAAMGEHSLFDGRAGQRFNDFIGKLAARAGAADRPQPLAEAG